MNRQSKFFKAAIIVAVGVFLILYAFNLMQHSEDIEVIIEPKEINQAVEAKSLQNVFEYMVNKALGGAEAGGLGSHSVIYYNLEQFLDLVPEGGIIYTTLEPGIKEPRDLSPDRLYVLNRTYWAFVSGIGIIVYKKPYEYQNKGIRYWIKSWDYSWDYNEGLRKVIFHYDNNEEVGIYRIFSAIALVCIVIFLLL